MERNSIEVEWNKIRELVKLEILVMLVYDKVVLLEEELERKLKFIIDEFLYINDFKEVM